MLLPAALLLFALGLLAGRALTLRLATRRAYRLGIERGRALGWRSGYFTRNPVPARDRTSGRFAKHPTLPTTWGQVSGRKF